MLRLCNDGLKDPRVPGWFVSGGVGAGRGMLVEGVKYVPCKFNLRGGRGGVKSGCW